MNIYQITNYRLLLIIPIIIIIFAISQLPKLKLGTEFTGGTLIVAITDKEVTQKELETTFSNYTGFYSNVYQTPNGFQIELEIKKSEDIEKAEALKNEISNLFDNYTNTLLQGNNTQIKFYEDTIKQKANELFLMTNYSNNKSVYEMSMSEIDNHVSNAYNFYLNNYYKEIETLLRTNYNISSLSINTITPTLSTRFIEEAKNVALFSGVLAFLIVMLYF
ncbi:MAG: hypothetical protein N3E37_06005, partial [Candidatus Micrarchaeota archaeon]|nr:hypothetical protein [Candidatus Micrarchaeota archaeon]